MTSYEYYKHIYRLAFITRYSNRFRVHNEDVAQHSFFVSAIVLQLYEEYSFNLGLALLAAVSHDIVEADLSDITHDITSKYRKLKQAIDEAECIEINKYPSSVQQGWLCFKECSTIEGKIANLADVLQVSHYIDLEISLGNTTLNSINCIARQRASSLREELKNYEKSIETKK